jgi:predicted flap endonuclease-1-like 5' DNA nuclease
MRSDYLLYVLAVVFFMITAVSLALVADQTDKSLWVLATVVLGLFSAGLGYYYRPKAKTAAAPTPEVQTAQPSDAHLREAHLAEGVEKHAEPTTTPVSASPLPMQVVAPIPVMTTPPVEVPAPLQSELMAIKGIGEKRVVQLKTVGINSIDDLAKISAEDLAKDLMISPKITRKWVESAKELQK